MQVEIEIHYIDPGIVWWNMKDASFYMRLYVL